jgi:RNA polymerase sigma-70 factor, ECF subfamily
MTWPPALPFTAVLGAARALDSRSVSLLYQRFLPVVYRFILARVSDIHVAEDLTSETFFAVLESIGGTRANDELAFAAWILGIARNRIAMHYRRQRSRPETTLDLSEDAPLYAIAGDEGDPLAILTARESWHEVVGALEHLTEDQRTVVLFRCVLDYSAEEVGQLMGKQAGTIRALQFRALASLARLLRAQPGAETRRIGNRQERSRGHAAGK